jgi:hypothetical protein
MNIPRNQRIERLSIGNPQYLDQEDNNVRKNMMYFHNADSSFLSKGISPIFGRIAKRTKLGYGMGFLQLFF